VIRGFFFSKAGFILMVIAVLIMLPTILLKMGVTENIFVDTFTNPFVAFSVIVITGAIATYNLFRPHWISVLHVCALVLVAFVYVWAILM